MASSNVPVPVPERPATPIEIPSPRHEASRPDKKSTRFVIKLGCPIPT
jgi:hypothetical protein